jgi:hypothetical protein
MDNQHFFTYLHARLLQFVSVKLNAFLALRPLKLTSNSLSSVSWNG